MSKQQISTAEVLFSTCFMLAPSTKHPDSNQRKCPDVQTTDKSCSPHASCWYPAPNTHIPARGDVQTADKSPVIEYKLQPEEMSRQQRVRHKCSTQVSVLVIVHIRFNLVYNQISLTVWLANTNITDSLTDRAGRIHHKIGASPIQGTQYDSQYARASIAVSSQSLQRHFGLPGVCFNKHDGPSYRATYHPPMLIVHSRMVRHPVDSPSCLLKQPPSCSVWSERIFSTVESFWLTCRVTLHSDSVYWLLFLKNNYRIFRKDSHPRKIAAGGILASKSPSGCLACSPLLEILFWNELQLSSWTVLKSCSFRIF